MNVLQFLESTGIKTVKLRESNYKPFSLFMNGEDNMHIQKINTTGNTGLYVNTSASISKAQLNFNWNPANPGEFINVEIHKSVDLATVVATDGTVQLVVCKAAKDETFYVVNGNITSEDDFNTLASKSPDPAAYRAQFTLENKKMLRTLAGTVKVYAYSMDFVMPA